MEQMCSISKTELVGTLIVVVINSLDSRCRQVHEPFHFSTLSSVSLISKEIDLVRDSIRH